MESGELSEWRATLVVRETACLSPADRATADRLVAARGAGGTRPFDDWGDRRLVAEVRQVVAQIDARAVVDRRSRAEADRRVTLRPAPDTMAQLSSLLPAAQGVAVWASLTRAAEQARAAGDPRSRGQVMADTLVERVTEQAQAALRRLYARPESGALVAMDSTSRTVPWALALFLDLRDRTCRTAWCDGTIRRRDHVVDYARGGPTAADNGQGLCEQCNHVKQAPGWRATSITGPPGTRHTVRTTLPTGHAIISTTPRAPTPGRVRAGSRLELHLSNVALEYAA